MKAREHLPQIALNLLKERGDYRLVTGEDREVQEILSSRSIERLRNFAGSTPLLVIDEAQHVDQIGLKLKMLIDHCPDLEVIATGSSSFELANQVGEPLWVARRPSTSFPSLNSSSTE